MASEKADVVDSHGCTQGGTCPTLASAKVRFPYPLADYHPGLCDARRATLGQACEVSMKRRGEKVKK
jgi:hypothetical protein